MRVWVRKLYEYLALNAPPPSLASPKVRPPAWQLRPTLALADALLIPAHALVCLRDQRQRERKK